MPRKRQRFSRLNAELKASLGTAAAGTRAADYLNFLKGVSRIRQPRRPNSASMARFGVGVIPFGITPVATPVAYLASMTNQAEQIRLLFTGAANENNYGIKNKDPLTKPDPLFFPAQVKIFATVPGAASTPETSRVLPNQGTYKSVKGRSGSVPFGRTVTGIGDAISGTAETAIGDVDEEDVKRSLAAALKGAVGTGYKVKGISFVSEFWGVSKNNPGAKPSTLAALQAPS